MPALAEEDVEEEEDEAEVGTKWREEEEEEEEPEEGEDTDDSPAPAMAIPCGPGVRLACILERANRSLTEAGIFSALLSPPADNLDIEGIDAAKRASLRSAAGEAFAEAEFAEADTVELGVGRGTLFTGLPLPTCGGAPFCSEAWDDDDDEDASCSAPRMMARLPMRRLWR